MIRNEYPRPQFVRGKWQNLNGEWDFDFDDDDRGMREQWYESRQWSRKITVPFVYQSKLSGIGERTAHDVVWYRRAFNVNEYEPGQRVILHFGAVDYEAAVFVNGRMAVRHTGGHTSFETDITDYLREGEQELAVRVSDPHQDETIPRGKQTWEDQSRGIWYTNSTGIWQTVWLECVADRYLKSVQFTTLYEEGQIRIRCEAAGPVKGCRLNYQIRYGEELVADGSFGLVESWIDWSADVLQGHIFYTDYHGGGRLWTPETPNLFDVTLSLADPEGNVLDQVESYFGFRKVHIENGMVYLNNQPYYQKLVLDQGYWPDGLLTAPDDDAFRFDIEIARQMGFNGCRKHQKMEDPRFLYWADKLGYIVWGECASAPAYGSRAVNRLMDEWAEVVERDYNHPCILVWVPLNESWGVPHISLSRQQQHFSQTMYHYLHALDTTRLVISNDGWEMTETDICAIHNYQHGYKQETGKYREYREALATRANLIAFPSTRWDIYAPGFANRGEPVLLTEFGGIGFDVSGEPGWGYTSVENEEEFLADYERIMDAVYASRGLWGYCYTQLTDVEQEINGLLTYDRSSKCDLKKIREINDRYHVLRVKD